MGALSTVRDPFDVPNRPDPGSSHVQEHFLFDQNAPFP